MSEKPLIAELEIDLNWFPLPPLLPVYPGSWLAVERGVRMCDCDHFNAIVSLLHFRHHVIIVELNSNSQPGVAYDS